MVLRYNRSFILQASHFNGAETYELADKLLRGKEKTITPHDVLRLLRDCHGHNFKVELQLEGEARLDQLWLLPDELLETIVNRYNRTNLSVHPDFYELDKRVTTEMMAAAIHDRVKEVRNDISVIVTVYETDEISATYSA